MYICDDYCDPILIATTEVNQLLSYDLQSISAHHCLVKILAHKKEILVGAFGLSPNCAEYGLETRLTRTEIIRILELKIHHICAENTQETWIGIHDEIRYLHSTYSLPLQNIASKHDSLQANNFVYTLKLLPLGGENVNETLLARNNENNVLVIDLQTISTEYGHEIWLVPTTNFLYWPSNYGISVLNMFWKHDTSQMNKCLYWRSTHVYYWIWARDSNRTIGSILCTGARPTVYMC